MDTEQRGMEAVLKFPLPENEWDFKHAVKGADYYTALTQIDHHIRDRLKYGDISKPLERELSVLRELIRELVDLE